ncbi:TonB-dependent receptor [Gammaproteobacteria bacterium]|nr:TonB-dependent receptor [Gammaproteobacteria bacterium]
MKKFLSVLVLISSFSIAQDEIEEIIVSSSILDKTFNDIGNPIHIVSGDDLSNDATQSIGETLDDLLGIASADYGAAVGQPIIRGMSGSRVKILENGIVNRDVSGLGADHFNDIDLSNAQQIEVVRGPSSLLYANGTVGGIINIVDNSIPNYEVERAVKVGVESQSVNDGDTQSLSFQNNFDNVNVTFSYKNTSLGNYDIPSGAVIHSDEEEHHEEDEHDEEEHDEEDKGYLANTDFETEATKFGVSTVKDWGYLGFSVSNTESSYGIPFHGDDHSEDGDEHDEDHDDEEEHDEHEGERIFSNTESDKFDIKGSYNFDGLLANKVDFFFRDSDYSFTEQHAEEEHEDEDHDEEEHDEHEGEGPTTFTNESSEYGAIFDFSTPLLSQKVSLNIIDEETSIIGAEAFMQPAISEEVTLGYYLSREFGDVTFDFGIRIDNVDSKGSVSEHEEDHHDEDEDHDDHDEDEEMESTFYDRSFNNTSLAVNLGRQLNDYVDLDFGISSVERAPSSIEMFMNGAHLATGRFEVGNVNLNPETSNNLDVTVNFSNGSLFAYATIFRNDIDNYIYLQDETEEEHEEHDEEHEEDHDDHGGLILANYLQQDAEMDGYEIEIGNTFDLASGALTLSLGRDDISGELSNGNNIPRLTPARNIYTVKYVKDDMNFELKLKDVEKQSDIAIGETPTDGYQMLNFKLTKTFDLQQGEFTLSLFGKNMLDEVARNHASFVKNEVPLPGRNYGIRFNLSF